MTPMIPRRSGDRPPNRESLHRKSKSLPASTPATPAAAGARDSSEMPTTPLSPSSDSNIDKVRAAWPRLCTAACQLDVELVPGFLVSNLAFPAAAKVIDSRDMPACCTLSALTRTLRCKHPLGIRQRT